MENVVNFPTAEQATESSKFVVGVSISHIYQIEVDAGSADEALLRFDDWLRSAPNCAELTPTIRATNLDVIGMGKVEGDTILDVGGISDETQKTLGERGELPQQGCLHLFPAPTPVVN